MLIKYLLQYITSTGVIMNAEIIVEIERLITTIGFPIVCVIFMWRKITESDEKQTQLLTELIIAINNLTEYIKGNHNNDSK